MIQIEDLVKEYGPVKALNGLNLRTQTGEVLALLGPNGAGKSTTIKSIIGLVHPDSGRILIDHVDVTREPRRARALIGYLPQRIAFYDHLSAREVLAFFAQLRKAPLHQINPLLERVGLMSVADRKTAGFSGGMLQRLGLAVALLGHPRLLVLDEPTAGLDPEGSILFKEIIREQHAAGVTILLSSHLLAEVQSLSSRIAICSQGKIVALDTLDHLRGRLAQQTNLVLHLSNAHEEAAALAMSVGASHAAFQEGVLRVSVPNEHKSGVVRALESNGIVVADLRTEDASLEEIFLAYVHQKELV